jgi:hypothetical protein
MSDWQIVIVDTAQIQPYVFGSNRLRENVGGSYLVAQATGAWAIDCLMVTAPRNNWDQDAHTFRSGPCIDDKAWDLDAEIIFFGGGNFVVVFSNVQKAKDFSRALSLKVLHEAPGLQIVIVRENYQKGQNFNDHLQNAFEKLAKHKEERPASSPILGLGATAACQSTGLPAVELVKPESGNNGSLVPVSADIREKRKVVDAANKRLKNTFSQVLGEKYLFPTQLDHLGRSETEFSYIAVVHADGNSMGDRIQKIGKQHGSDNCKFINTIRSFSEALKTTSSQALEKTLENLVSSLDKDGHSLTHNDEQGKKITRLNLARAEQGRWYLPVRPIVYGGDDVTFVCDGRLGISLALDYMEHFKAATSLLPDDAGSATACAGISIVKAHYPFARAYDLAEKLCQSAKDYRRDVIKKGGSPTTFCLDWHFALSGLFGSIADIRKIEYSAPDNRNMTLRPVTVGENVDYQFRTWNVVQHGIVGFQHSDWRTRRNKLKALRDTLRAGPDEVKAFCLKFNNNDPLPNVFPSDEMKKTGWSKGFCGYFDALELADWFVPLKSRRPKWN